jgi:hypothetical protein
MRDLLAPLPTPALRPYLNRGFVVIQSSKKIQFFFPQAQKSSDMLSFNDLFQVKAHELGVSKIVAVPMEAWSW